MPDKPKGGESLAHRRLKQSAVLWAQENGYRICAEEIRVPNSNFRADVAACKIGKHKSDSPGKTALFECKQARSDFLKDHHQLAESLEKLHELNERRSRIETQLGIHYPSLRQGDSLFSEFQTVDPSALEHDGYRNVTRELATIERRIFGKTKFDRMVRWSCADLLYIVCPESILKNHELPSCWGLLTSPSDCDLNDSAVPLPTLTLQQKPTLLECESATRLRLLQNIALSATKRRSGIGQG